ncbi:uncharacterized protein PV07_10318 [Cladophialophora immunda]|uniref:Uncharacterized protein n=1 Tax=Cladophialophora immunda TaxID=569365 RepID=A0A0D2BZU8_9EURO|nr:uncharacterized protein PV07_10318 [Cladophialophora immunda]KIW24613.1 hypothetical protein PV07_10318 [Cladophialophora immunda]OQV00809.1 hypothetical protein CLAIMM_06257 [Cladophialophora immunda]
MASTSSVAFITGGASGMGLALVERLVAEGWNVTVFDFNNAAGEQVQKRLGGQVLFLRGNVINYDDQAQAFVKTWEKWGRLDLVWGNAGIGDRIEFCSPMPEGPNGAPPKPDTLVVDICLYGVIWTGYLALHFFRKNPSKAGKLVFTSSLAGVYPAAPVPLYGAAKHGVIGLVRSMAKRLQEMGEPITVNCVCPGLVATPLVSQKLVEVMPKDMTTPTETVVRAILQFAADASITGQAAECSGTEIHYRPVLPYSNSAAEYMVEGKYANLVDKDEMMQDSAEKGKLLDAMVSDRNGTVAT